jgi:hypothetical protein
MFSSSGVLAFGVAFAVCVAVWPISVGPEARLRMRNTAIGIARMVIFLIFLPPRVTEILTGPVSRAGGTLRPATPQSQDRFGLL